MFFMAFFIFCGHNFIYRFITVIPSYKWLVLIAVLKNVVLWIYGENVKEGEMDFFYLFLIYYGTKLNSHDLKYHLKEGANKL